MSGALQPGWQPRWQDGWRGTLLTAAVVGFVVGVALLGVVAARTVYRWDVTLRLVATAMPAVAALGLAAAMRWSDDLNLSNGAGPLVGIVALLLVAPANAALWLNQVADRSGAVERPLAVLGKAREQRRGGITYTLRVDPGLARPIPGFTLYPDGEAIPVSRASYDAAVPGRSALVLALHPGRLGFPWWEKDPRLLP